MAYTRIEFTNLQGQLVAFGREHLSLLSPGLQSNIFKDHTKYVGKSHNHSVCHLSIHCLRLDHPQLDLRKMSCFQKMARRLLKGMMLQMNKIEEISSRFFAVLRPLI